MMKIYKRLKSLLTIATIILLTGSPLLAGAQDVKVTGTVVDEGGFPLNGAVVVVKGTTAGVVTNNQGFYEIKAAPASTLVFSYLGYDDKEVKLGAATVVNVTLTESANTLDELVVVGYGSRRKKDLTGSLVVAGQDQLQMVSTPNLMDRLVGQVAGLSITTDNEAPGAAQSIIIRGINSLSAGNSPLIVLDGIPYSGGLSDLDPNNIENLTILKDASSVAIYGSQGSNGVILIQSKRGVKGRAQVSYKGSFSFAEPQQRIEVMGPNEYIRLRQDIGRIRSGYTGDQLDPMAGLIISASEKINYAQGITNNWQNYVFRTSFTQNHQVSVTGGSDTFTYSAALAHLDDEGVVYNSRLVRDNVSLNLNQTFNKWLTIGVSTQYIQKETGGITPNLEHAIKQSPYGLYKDETGNYVEKPQEYDNVINPMANVNADQDNTTRNFILNAFAEIKFPVNGLTFKSLYGHNYRNNFTGTYYGRNTVTGKKVDGKASISTNNYTDYTWENILKYDKEFCKKHRLELTGLFSVYQTRTVSASESGESFVTDDTSYYMIGTAEKNVTASSGLSEQSMLSYMGRINYVFNDKYMLTLTGRTDGASNFARNNKYAFFPSAAVAWHIGEEGFVKNNAKWVDMLKLRLSYGANGNQAIPIYRSLDRLYSKVKYTYGDNTAGSTGAFYPNDGFGNPNLKWETTYTANVGVDFQLFHNRLGGTIDAYLANTFDLLMKRNVPIMNGYNTLYDNVGQTRNKGIEITLNGQPIRNKDFTWNIDVNFSLNRDEIVALREGGGDDVTNKWFIGKALKVFYDYKPIGVWQTGDDFTYTDKEGNKIDSGTKPGDAKLQDTNGDGYITPDDRVQMSKTPSFYASMGHKFTYKSFYLSFLVNGVFGVWHDDNVANFGQYTFGQLNYIHGANYWTPENPHADIVSPGYTNSLGHGFYKKLSYVAIKNITVGYNVPNSFTKKIGLSSVNVNLSVNNPHTFANMRQVLNYDNTWFASYPTARSYVLGVNLNF